MAAPRIVSGLPPLLALEKLGRPTRITVQLNFLKIYFLLQNVSPVTHLLNLVAHLLITQSPTQALLHITSVQSTSNTVPASYQPPPAQLSQPPTDPPFQRPTAHTYQCTSIFHPPPKHATSSQDCKQAPSFPSDNSVTTTVPPSARNITYTSSKMVHCSSKAPATTQMASGISHFLPKHPLLLLMHLLAPTLLAAPSMLPHQKAISQLSFMVPCLVQQFLLSYEPSNAATSQLSLA